MIATGNRTTCELAGRKLLQRRTNVANCCLTHRARHAILAHMTTPPTSRPAPLDVTVIIVNYNVRAFLKQALRSVERSLENLRAEIVVVDNHSLDGSCTMVRREFPGVHLIVNTENVGFAKANNQAIVRARGRCLLILNPDTIVQKETIATMVAFLDAHPSAGAVGCQILNPDGSFALESRRAFPSASVAFYRMTGLSHLFPRSRIFGRYNLGYLPQDEVAEVDALSGSCMMVRRAAIAHSAAAFAALTPAERLAVDATTRPHQLAAHGGAGIFDEGFFMYGEDLDWCYRLQQAGWKIFYTPDTSIIHYKGESTKKNRLRYVRLFYGAMIRFAKKHLSRRYPPLFLWLLRIAVVVRGSLTALGQACGHRATHEGALVLAIMLALGTARFLQPGVELPALFFWVIAPAFAVITTSSIGILGGYQGRGRRLASVAAGVALSVLLLSAASFFIKTIAFSRAVVLASLPVCLAALTAYRLARTTRRKAPRRTLLVGSASEAIRLQRAQSGENGNPFTVLGFVPVASSATDGAEAKMDEDIPRFEPLESLRELVQVHDIEVVVFASASLSNKSIFTLVRRLARLPVETWILAQHHAHAIGKSTVDLLHGATLVEAQEALGYMRSRGAHRIFDAAMAVLGAALHPLVWLAARLGPVRPFWEGFSKRTRRWPEVLVGRAAVVGYHTDEVFDPPGEWPLKPGIFAVTESLGTRAAQQDSGVEQVYWSYVRRQSAAVDWLIVLRAVRALWQQTGTGGKHDARRNASL